MLRYCTPRITGGVLDDICSQLEVTNYRFRKSMGWEIKPALLYQAYVWSPSHNRAGILGGCRFGRQSKGS